MAEPVEPAADFPRIIGAAGTVQLRRKVAATDSHAAAEDVTAVADPIRVETRGVGEGEVRVTVTTYYIGKLAAAIRPPLQSLIVDGSVTWVVESVTEPAGCWACGVVLA